MAKTQWVEASLSQFCKKIYPDFVAKLRYLDGVVFVI
jgi:hypothetical protein